MHTYLSRHAYIALLSGPNHISIEVNGTFANGLCSASIWY